MSTHQLTETAGADGMLHLHVPVAEPNRPYRVLISVEPAQDVERDERGWPKGFFDLAGTWEGDFPKDFEGDYEKRLEF